MPIADPSSLANLVDWWEPADATVSGSNVTAWPGVNAISLAPAGTPTRVTSGQPSGSYSISVGSGNYLQVTSSNMVTGTTCTVVATLKLGTLTTNGRVLSFATDGGSADWNNAGSFVLHPYSVPQWPGGFRNNNPLPTSASVTAGVWHLLMIVFDGADCTIWEAVSGDSGWTQAATGANTGTFNIDVFTLGANPSGGDNHTVEYGDIAFYADAKGTTDRDDLWTWFNTRAFGAGADNALLTPPRQQFNVHRM